MTASFDFLHRTEALLGSRALGLLAGSTVAVAGLGGGGGAVAPVLVRLRAGSMKIADPGKYDLPDLNRQHGGFGTTIGPNKTAVYEEMLRSINPL